VEDIGRALRLDYAVMSTEKELPPWAGCLAMGLLALAVLFALWSIVIADRGRTEPNVHAMHRTTSQAF
jgi:hypothetical protein